MGRMKPSQRPPFLTATTVLSLAAATALTVPLFISGCSSHRDEVPLGCLEISFTLVGANDLGLEFEPSYQTVVWLEDEAGRIVRNLLVSEYLAYGGYEEPEICPRWSRSSDWGNVSEALFDSVTRATPPVGVNTVVVDCAAEKLAAGVYHYCVQTHIMEEENILFRGRIEIGRTASESRAEVSRSPDHHQAAQNLLANVAATYRPPEQ